MGAAFCFFLGICIDSATNMCTYSKLLRRSWHGSRTTYKGYLRRSAALPTIMQALNYSVSLELLHC